MGSEESHMTEQQQLLSRASCAFLIELYSYPPHPPPRQAPAGKNLDLGTLHPWHQPSSGGSRILGHQGASP